MNSLRFEYARLNSKATVRCFRCEVPLEQGERYIAGTTFVSALESPALKPWFDPESGLAWYHLACALDVNLQELSYTLRTAPSNTALDSLRELARARTKAINATIRARKGASFKPKSVDAIEATCDPSGRPRRTVAYFGSLVSAGETKDNPLRDFARDSTIRTARREYVFEPFSGTDTAHLACDPSRPLIGAVFATFAHTKIVKLQRDKLALLRAFGVRTPILWLYGEELAVPKLRDAKVQAMREALDAAGFDGDEAVCVCSAENSADALEELGRALDELETETAAPLRLDEQLDRSVAVLEAALARGADHQLAALLDAIPKLSDEPTLRARTLRAIEQCLAYADSRPSALACLQRFATRECRAALLTLVAQLVIEPGRSFAPELTTAYSLLRLDAERELYALWASALEHDANKSARRYEALRAALESCDDTAIGEQIATWSASLLPSDRRRASAIALADTIAARTKRTRKARRPPAKSQ